MDFGRAVRIARATRGVSQRKLAARAGLDSSFVSMLEAGKRQPSVATLEQIGQALQMPFYVLALLATEEADLRGVTPRQAARQVEELLGIIVAAQDEQ